MLCIWSNQKGVIHYELLKPRQTITRQFYRQELVRLKPAENRPECATRHESIIFHHYNARPHVAVPIKNYLVNSGREVLTRRTAHTLPLQPPFVLSDAEHFD